MTMLSKVLAVCLAVTAGLLLCSPAQAADNVISLAKFDSNAPTLSLAATADDLDADTIDVVRRGYYGGYRGGYYGGYRGVYYGYRGGYYGGYRGGYYGGYRGGYYGGYRGGYYGYSRPYYGGYYGYSRPYYGGYYGGYRGGYYGYRGGYYGGYRGGYRGGYWGISDPGDDYALTYPLCNNSYGSRTLVIQPSSAYLPQPAQPRQLPGPTPIPRMPNADEGTYPYDGGPMNPVPMPKQEARPTIVPYASVYPEERLVSLTPDAPALLKVKSEPKTGKWTYPAYGESPTRTGRK
jgi:hypothetical protein